MIRLLPVAALALLLTGCAATPVIGSASPEGSSVTSAEAAANAAAGNGGGDGTPYDACGLVSAADVKALIGSNDGGKASSAPGADGGGCIWTNTDNEYNLSVDIGDTDTAINGLPELDPAFGPAEPLPGGMRYFASAVDFPAKGRKCSVQVSTLDSTPGGDKAAALKLAQELTAKI